MHSHRQNGLRNIISYYALLRSNKPMLYLQLLSLYIRVGPILEWQQIWHINSQHCRNYECLKPTNKWIVCALRTSKPLTAEALHETNIYPLSRYVDTTLWRIICWNVLSAHEWALNLHHSEYTYCYLLSLLTARLAIWHQATARPPVDGT